MLPNWNVAALLLTFALGQATAGPAHTATYHSDTLHMDYTYDSSLIAMDSIADQAKKTASDEATGVKKAAIGCISLPLTAVNTDHGLRMTMLMRIDSKCLGIELKPDQLGPLTTKSLTEALHRMGGDPQMGELNTYDLAGRTATSLSGRVSSEKYQSDFYGMAACTTQGGDGACWEFVSTDCSKISALIAANVTFEGRQAEPVIPAKYSITCPAAK